MNAHIFNILETDMIESNLDGACTKNHSNGWILIIQLVAKIDINEEDLDVHGGSKYKPETGPIIDSFNAWAYRLINNNKLAKHLKN